jgi:hypothetical protein
MTRPAEQRTPYLVVGSDARHAGPAGAGTLLTRRPSLSTAANSPNAFIIS